MDQAKIFLKWAILIKLSSSIFLLLYIHPQTYTWTICLKLGWCMSFYTCVYCNAIVDGSALVISQTGSPTPDFLLICMANNRLPWWLSISNFLQVVSNCTSNVRDLGSIPGLGRSVRGGHGNPLQYSCLENPHGQRSRESCSPWGNIESDMTELQNTAQYPIANDFIDS